MQNHSNSETAELLQKSSSKPFFKCCICYDNILAVKRELGLRGVDGKKYSEIPVIGFIVEAYFEDPIYQDTIVESTLCAHKCHLTCMIRFARRIYKDEIENPSLMLLAAGRKWKCPSARCNMWHADATTLQVRDRSQYDVGFYQESMEVVIRREYLLITFMTAVTYALLRFSTFVSSQQVESL